MLDSLFPIQRHSVAAWPWDCWRRCVAAADWFSRQSDWGALYRALQVSRYIPQALASGAILIALVNWIYYRRKAARMVAGHVDCDCGVLRRAMLLSGFLGLAMMAVSFVFLEWLNHAVVNAARFMGHHQFGGAVIPGVPNSHLAYLAATFLVLPLLAILPLPQQPARANPDRASSGQGVTL